MQFSNNLKSLIWRYIINILKFFTWGNVKWIFSPVKHLILYDFIVNNVEFCCFGFKCIILLCANWYFMYYSTDHKSLHKQELAYQEWICILSNWFNCVMTSNLVQNLTVWLKWLGKLCRKTHNLMFCDIFNYTVFELK